MLNDLAEAMKALEGKNTYKLTTSSATQGSSQLWVPHGDSTYLHLSTQHLSTQSRQLYLCIVGLHSLYPYCHGLCATPRRRTPLLYAS